MNAPFPAEVQRAFGPKLCQRIDDAIARVLVLKPVIPDSSSLVYLRPYATTASDIRRPSYWPRLTTVAAGTRSSCQSRMARSCGWRPT